MPWWKLNGLVEAEIYSQMVRLEAAETWARMAGRAALVAIWPVMRAAETRRAAIATVVEGSGGGGWVVS